MILWDTSAFVRCYKLREPGSGRAMRLLMSGDRQGGSVLLLPEVLGVLSRMVGLERAMRDRVLKRAREQLASFELLSTDIAQAELAARFAVEFALRGADALHLAAACLMAREMGREVRFVTSDRDQAAAARAEKLKVILVA